MNRDASGQKVERLLDQIPQEKIPPLPGRPTLLGIPKEWIVNFLLSVLAIFSFYTAAMGEFTGMIQRPFHLLLILCITYFCLDSKLFKKGSFLEEGMNLLFIVLSVVSLVYYMLNWERMQATYDLNEWDLYMGFLILLVIFEGNRRTSARPLGYVLLISVLYVKFGRYLPGVLGHPGFSFERMIFMLVVGYEGVFSSMMSMCSTFVILFMYFAAFLQVGGGAKVLLRLAFALTGHMVGGPAKVAVIGSSLMGTISGSAVTNVVTTGTVTIPMMRARGYPPYMAAAIESTASSGGQLMPPIMGVSAFLIAEYMEISYFTVCLAAVVPAVLYYFAVFMQIHYFSMKGGLEGMPKEDLPAIWPAFKETLHILISLATLVICLYFRYTTSLSISYALAVFIIVSSLRKSTRLKPADYFTAFKIGTRNMLMLTLSLGVAGSVVGILSLSGLGMKLTRIIEMYSYGHLVPALFLTAMVAIVLGMGVIVVAAFVFMANLTVPLLVKMGAGELGAYLFIHWFTVIGTLTPPVMLTIYTAAALAGASPIPVAKLAIRLAIVGYVIPFLFVLYPPLLLEGSWQSIVFICGNIIFGLYALASVFEGVIRSSQLTKLARIILGAAAVGLVLPETLSSLVSLPVFFYYLIFYPRRAKPVTVKEFAGVKRLAAGLESEKGLANPGA